MKWKMNRKGLELSEEDWKKLLEIVEKARDGEPKAVAEQQNLNLDTVYDRRKGELAEGFDSLVDKHRCGVASKVSQASTQKIYGFGEKIKCQERV